METRVSKRISQIKDDMLDLRAVYGPLGEDLAKQWYVRGVPVQRMQITRLNERGQMFRLCIFPDFRQMWVNEGNLASRRIPRFAGEMRSIDRQEVKEAA